MSSLPSLTAVSCMLAAVAAVISDSPCKPAARQIIERRIT